MPTDTIDIINLDYTKFFSIFFSLILSLIMSLIIEIHFLVPVLMILLKILMGKYVIKSYYTIVTLFIFAIYKIVIPNFSISLSECLAFFLLSIVDYRHPYYLNLVEQKIENGM